MDTQTKAKKAAILKLMHGYPSSQSRITEEVVEAYLDAVEQFSPESVMRGCQRFTQGDVPNQSLEFLPSAASLAAQARLYDQIVGSATADKEMARIVSYPLGGKPPPGMEELGPTKIEIGGRLVDVSHLTLDEKIEALKSGRLPADEKPATPKLQRF